ncbi:MAG: hypothetical protein II670_11490 [Alphaproteobacteria bacterium]|nr:hypothetical protein [Alphaproteobacteria bacterium]
MYNTERFQSFFAIDSCGTMLFEKYLFDKISHYEIIARDFLTENDIKEKDSILHEIESAKNAIIQTINYSLQGRRLLAIMTLLEFVNKHMPPLCHEEIGSDFYRMRVFEDKRSREIKELFHIPFDKQGIVKTQRYSMPGLPCLYLGKSLYGCWEELNRPPLHSCMFSRLSNTKVVKLWDFRIPDKIENVDELKKLLPIMPLLISCSIKVSNPKDNFKPEYIIPQMMLEILSCGDEISKINGRKPANIMGIKYRSVLTNNDFDFPPSKSDNIVIPAMRGTEKYDSRLCDLFQITQPTCEEFEKIRYRQLIIDGGAAFEEIDTYKNSLFGEMETFISSTDTFPLLNIENEPLGKDNNFRT